MHVQTYVHARSSMLFILNGLARVHRWNQMTIGMVCMPVSKYFVVVFTLHFSSQIILEQKNYYYKTDCTFKAA